MLTSKCEFGEPRNKLVKLFRFTKKTTIKLCTHVHISTGLSSVAYLCLKINITTSVVRFVGTPGLGYPLLLCRGKGLVVILDYVQTAGPLRSGVLFPRQRSRTCLTAGKGPGTPRVPEEAGAQPEQPGLRTSRGVRTPNRTPH